MGKTSGKRKSLDSRSSFNLGKDAKESSRLGLLLAFLTIIFVGLMGIWICISTFGRHKPAIIQYEQPPQVYNPTIPFTTDDFVFGLSLLDIDYYQHTVVRYDYEYWKSGVDYFLAGINMNKNCQFGILPGKMFNCFYQDENTKGKTYLDTEGSWSFKIRYNSCHLDNPSGSGCSSENNINQYLDRLPKATLVYEDVAIDPYNYESPFTTVENYVSALLSVDVGTTLVVELNEIEFISDDGWVFENLKTETKLKATTSLKVSRNDMLNVQLIYGGKKTVYKRTYPKIQDLFAHISGFLTILTPLLLLLVSQYDNRKAIQHMINEVYEIKLKKPNNSGGGDSPAGKNKSKSSKFTSLPTTTGAVTERNLLSQAAMSKFKNRARPTEFSQKGIPFPPHAALVIACLDNLEEPENPQKVPTKDDISQIPEENIEPFRFDSFEKAPSSPLKSALVSPRHDESKLLTSALTTSLGHPLPKKPENERLNLNLEPTGTNRENGNKSLAEEDSESEEEEEVPLRTSDPLKVPWKDWLKSIWKPSPEVQVMKKAKEHIMETFDLVTLSKKVSEIDKLKACLLTHEQRVIFENLPSSVIVLNPNIDIKKPEAIKQYNWSNTSKGDEEALRKAYSKLKEQKGELDKLLLKFYESENICDGLAS